MAFYYMSWILMFLLILVMIGWYGTIRENNKNRQLYINEVEEHNNTKKLLPRK